MRLLVLALALGFAGGCTTLQASAAQDPMRCERDPKCTAHQDKAKDCVTACVDDPECIDRCRMITGQR